MTNKEYIEVVFKSESLFKHEKIKITRSIDLLNKLKEMYDNQNQNVFGYAKVSYS